MTRPFAATYYDGRTTAKHGVQVLVGGSHVAVRGETVTLDYSAGQLRYRPRIAGAPLDIELPDGGLLVAPFEDASRQLPVPSAADLAHRLERHVLLVLLSIVGFAAAAWFAYRDGVPWLAAKAAQRLPESVESEIAERGLPLLDRLVFRPSRLPADERRRVQATFARLVAIDRGSRPRLEFRDGGRLGPNALAVPGGVVIVTDQLVDLMQDDALVEAVLAHELGHLRHRHGTRRILQASMMGLLSAAIFGDVASVGTLAAVVPSVLVSGSYSRDNEREADAYAFALLRRDGKSPEAFAQAMRKFMALGHKPEGGEPRDSYLGSHPVTEERIRAAEEASRR